MWQQQFWIAGITLKTKVKVKKMSYYAVMGESSKFPKCWTLEIQILKLKDAYKNG